MDIITGGTRVIGLAHLTRERTGWSLATTGSSISRVIGWEIAAEWNTIITGIMIMTATTTTGIATITDDHHDDDHR